MAEPQLNEFTEAGWAYLNDRITASLTRYALTPYKIADALANSHTQKSQQPQRESRPRHLRLV